MADQGLVIGISVGVGIAVLLGILIGVAVCCNKRAKSHDPEKIQTEKKNKAKKKKQTKKHENVNGDIRYPATPSISISGHHNLPIHATEVTLSPDILLDHKAPISISQIDRAESVFTPEADYGEVVKPSSILRVPSEHHGSSIHSKTSHKSTHERNMSSNVSVQNSYHLVLQLPKNNYPTRPIATFTIAGPKEEERKEAYDDNWQMTERRDSHSTVSTHNGMYQMHM